MEQAKSVRPRPQPHTRPCFGNATCGTDHKPRWTQLNPSFRGNTCGPLVEGGIECAVAFPQQQNTLTPTYVCQRPNYSKDRSLTVRFTRICGGKHCDALLDDGGLYSGTQRNAQILYGYAFKTVVEPDTFRSLFLDRVLVLRSLAGPASKKFRQSPRVPSWTVFLGRNYFRRQSSQTSRRPPPAPTEQPSDTTSPSPPPSTFSPTPCAMKAKGLSLTLAFLRHKG